MIKKRRRKKKERRGRRRRRKKRKKEEESKLSKRMAGGETGGEAVSERRKMGATKYVLGSAILGLFWSSLLKGVLTNSTSRCDYPPCSCDHYGRLNCDCKEEGEVGTIMAVLAILPHENRALGLSHMACHILKGKLELKNQSRDIALGFF